MHSALVGVARLPENHHCISKEVVSRKASLKRAGDQQLLNLKPNHLSESREDEVCRHDVGVLFATVQRISDYVDRDSARL